MSQSVQFNTAQNVNIDINVASIWDRILAFLIDRLIMLGYVLFILVMVLGIAGNDLTTVPTYLFGLLSLPILFYSLLFEVYNNGQTPGKKVINIKVVAIDGGEVTFGMYFLRWLFRLVDINILSGILAILVIGFNEKGQRIGDIVANTSVISEKENKIKKTLIHTHTQEGAQIFYNEAEALQPRDIETIQAVLQVKGDKGFELKSELSAKLEEVLQVKKEGSSTQFLKTLVRDYNLIQRGMLEE